MIDRYENAGPTNLIAPLLTCNLLFKTVQKTKGKVNSLYIQICMIDLLFCKAIFAEKFLYRHY